MFTTSSGGAWPTVELHCRTYNKTASLTQSLHILGEFMTRRVHSVVHYSNYYLQTLKSDRRTHLNQDIWDSIHYIQFSLDKSQQFGHFISISFYFFQFNYMCGSYSATLHMMEEVVFQLREGATPAATTFIHTFHVGFRLHASPKLQRVSPERNRTVAK